MPEVTVVTDPKCFQEYHKIETLYERDEKTFKLKPELILKNRVYGALKTWHWTEKVDGTNVRIMWDHANDRVRFGGRTDNAQLPTDLVVHLYETYTPKLLREVFPDTPATLYGEGFGAGIQKGGGDYSPSKQFTLFDVLVNGEWWLNWENVCDVSNRLNMLHVYYIGEMSLEDATEKVRQGFPSLIGGGKKQAEGLVGRPIETLFDKKGHRLICKLKTKDF